MSTLAPMARVPFAPLDNPRLQHLASTKNRQNGVNAKSTLFGGKPAVSLSTAPTKRPFEPAIFDDYDAENVDPASLCSPTKKSKNDVSDRPFRPFTFTMTPAKATPPPPPPSRLGTPARANMSSPRAPLTAPAGRSPTKRKGSILLNNKIRRTSAPFSRIDPPSFNSSRPSSALPFSLDAALNGTFATPTATSTASSKTSAGATIAESLPKNWFFEIHQDTPEEEASNLMEHSTLTLDLSSDDESEKKLHDERGKENMPPEGYDAVTASRSLGDAMAPAPSRVKKTDLVRKKVVTDEMDDGERSPLANLETEPFIPEGLDLEAHIVVDPAPEKTKAETKSLFAAPAPFSAVSTKKDSAETNSKGDIVVWEDSTSEPDMPPPEVSLTTKVGTRSEKVIDDENVPLPAEDVVQ